MKTVHDFRKWKSEKKPITMVTSYDFWSAQIINESDIDSILVGDSASMVMHGYSSTLNATMDMLELHVAAVAKGAPGKFIVADLPFGSFRQGKFEAIKQVDRFMKAGAHAVKLEGIGGHEDVIEHLIGSGVPVMGHLGLTPQWVNQLGGMKVQAKTLEAQDLLASQAKALQNTGCFSLVLECVQSTIAAQVTASLDIPTIGIGAGAGCDGQILVLQDLLGLQPGFKPKFLRTYMNGYEQIKSALNQYCQDVNTKKFPNSKESYE